jgi:hypothetical protein
MGAEVDHLDQLYSEQLLNFLLNGLLQVHHWKPLL